jgi:hypothetical protein
LRFLDEITLAIGIILVFNLKNNFLIQYLNPIIDVRFYHIDSPTACVQKVEKYVSESSHKSELRWKMRPVETILWMEEEGIKENDGGDECNLGIS